MDLRRLRYFLVVAEEEHLRKAAERLRIAQSALSKRIAELEEELGQPLFERLPRGIRLLPSGRLLQRHALKILAGVDEVRADFQRFAEGVRGTLRIGMSNRVAQIPFVTRAICRFKDEHAQVDQALSSHANSGLLANAIFANDLDMAFLYNPPKSVHGLAYCTLRSYGPIIALPQGHRLADRPMIELADLERETILLFSRMLDPPTYDSFIAAFFTAGLSPEVVHEIGSEELRLGLVAAGMGVTITNGSILERPRPEGLVFRPVGGIRHNPTLMLAWHPNADWPAMLAFRDKCQMEAAASPIEE